MLAVQSECGKTTEKITMLYFILQEPYYFFQVLIS